MPFVDLPQAQPMPQFPEEFSFHTSPDTVEELARTTLEDFLSGEDPVIVQAIWTQSFVDLNVRDLDPNFVLTARFSEHESGAPVLTALFVLPRTARPLDLAVVRTSLDELTRLATYSFKIRRRVDQLLDPWRTTARGNRERRPDSAYAALAMRYVQLVDSNIKNPRQALSDELNLSLPSISARVREARAYGFLSESAHGRAEGVLTDKARLALDKAILGTKEEG